MNSELAVLGKVVAAGLSCGMARVWELLYLFLAVSLSDGMTAWFQG